MVASFRMGFASFLLDQGAVVSLIGERLWASRLPDKPVLPAVVYRVVTNLGAIDHEGAVELRNPRVQLDVWGRKPSEIEPIADALTEALLGYRGPMGEVDYTAGWVLEDTTDMYEEESTLYRISMDFRGWYGTG